VITLHIPPLRERPADIAALADYFGRKYALANSLPERSLSNEARTKLAGHSWPGNVRELENAMHRAVLLSTGAQIDAFAVRLPEGARTSNPAAQAASRAAEVMARSSPETGGFIGQTVAEVEQQLILGTLNHCFGNRTHAANILGISIRTLRNKLKDYTDLGLEVPAPQGAGASAA
jgi:DNA-binding NtrC family response regulator